MELMSLLAKLTLDKTEYDKGLDDAEKDAKGLNIPTPKIPKTDNADFKQGVEEAEETGNIFQEVMNGVWDGIKDGLVSTGIVTTIASIVGWMKQGISLAIDNGKSISDNAKNLKISTKAYQEYDYILGKSGLTMKDLSKTMTTLNKIRGGDITEKQAAALKDLGISAEEATSGMMSAEDLLSSIMSSLAGYGESNKDSIINTLFGSKSEWIGFFGQTEEELAAMRKQAQGLILSDESIANAVEFKQTVEGIQETFTGMQQSFGEKFIPMLTDAVKGVATIIDFFSGGKANLSQIFGDADSEMGKNLATIDATAEAAMDVVDRLFNMGDAEKFTAEQAAQWRADAEWLVANIPSLSGVIDADTMSINANRDAISQNIAEWRRLSTERAISEAKEKKYQAILAENADAIDKQATARAKANEAAVKQNEMIAEANNLIKNNQGLSDMFYGVFGEKGISKESANYQKMIDWMSTVGYEFANTSAFDTLKEQYNSLVNEQTRLQNEAESTSAQLESAMSQYEAWCGAIDEMYSGAASSAQTANSDAMAFAATIAAIPDEKIVHLGVTTDDYQPHAIGSAYIPYDNYPALLHRGERVLTATQARRGEGSGSSIDYGHLEDRIAAAIRNGMEGATVRSYLNGRDITQEVNRNNMNGIKGRRFAG